MGFIKILNRRNNVPSEVFHYSLFFPSLIFGVAYPYQGSFLFDKVLFADINFPENVVSFVKRLLN